MSSEHHQALVIARTVQRRVDAGEWSSEDGERLGVLFDSDIEPHFRVEEEVLLPALTSVAQHALVQRTRDDHKMLRRSVARARKGDAVAASEFASCLLGHVRFEERELFEACERFLDDAILDEVHRRAPKLAPGEIHT